MIVAKQYMLLGPWRMSRRIPTSLLGLGTTPGLVEIRILLLGAVPNVYYDDQHAAFAPLSDHYNSWTSIKINELIFHSEFISIYIVMTAVTVMLYGALRLWSRCHNDLISSVMIHDNITYQGRNPGLRFQPFVAYRLKKNESVQSSEPGVF